jgi:YegS/Rv2252/BmrU family lipid kinase
VARRVGELELLVSHTTGRPLLVVNPRSGGGKTAEIFSSMQATIEQALGVADVVFTERTGHAIELAREATTAGRGLVIAVGGDGTFNEVVNGVLEAGGGDRTRVGMVGQGTGGDFRKALGIEHRLDRYLDALASGHERKLDIGKLRYKDADGVARERYFVNILSAGMGGLVDRYVAEASRALGGTAAYLGASLKALAQCREGRLRCTSSGPNGEPPQERRVRTYMIAICNGQYFGSGMRVAPMAKVDDGLLDVISIGGASKLAFAMTARSIYSGGHLGKPGTEHWSCKKISIELENEDARERFLLDCDGEPIGGMPIDVELVPGAVILRA